MKRLFVLAGLFLFGLTFAAQSAAASQSCLSTSGDQSWVLPTHPVGPSWTMQSKFYQLSADDLGTFTATVWRRPCDNSESQAIMTVQHYGDARAAFGAFSIMQHGDYYDLLMLAVGKNWDSGLYILLDPTGGKILSGIIDPHLVSPNCCFDPNAGFDLVYKYAFPDGQKYDKRISVPAYNPAQYGADGDTPAGYVIGANTTGNWYDPAQSGQGFSIEVLEGHRLLARWYVFDEEGNHLWISAQGSYSGNSATLQAFTTGGAGGIFPPWFDKNRVSNHLWGTLTFQFDSCKAGVASWDPSVSGFTNGSMPIQRLTVPKGLNCQ